MTHGFEFPSAVELKSPENWTSVGDGTQVAIVRVVGEMGRPKLVDSDKVFYGQTPEDITTQGARRKFTRKFVVNSVDEAAVSQTVASEVLRALDLGVELQLPIAPVNLKVGVSTQFKRARHRVVNVSHTETFLCEVTEEIEIPAGEDRRLFAYTTYGKFEAPLVVCYIDYLVLDYSSGQRRILTQIGKADRNTAKRLGGSGFTNEIPIGENIGTVEFFIPTGQVHPIYHNSDALLLCNPHEASFTPENVPNRGTSYRAKIRLVEWAKGRQFRSLRDR